MFLSRGSRGSRQSRRPDGLATHLPGFRQLRGPKEASPRPFSSSKSLVMIVAFLDEAWDMVTHPAQTSVWCAAYGPLLPGHLFRALLADSCHRPLRAKPLTLERSCDTGHRYLSFLLSMVVGHSPRLRNRAEGPAATSPRGENTKTTRKKDDDQSQDVE
ncbi:uncharacterized protein BDV17DRAFT_197076 [Aspergillus undulatus]|uniref:uncharacterized protein n=1 Tax=Aspergillus undulatus TaxID=1810928 RepID=UPI003CCE5000